MCVGGEGVTEHVRPAAPSPTLRLRPVETDDEQIFSDMSTLSWSRQEPPKPPAALGTTKSIVSTRIQKLERRLACALLKRGRSPQLTDPGQRFFEQSRQLLQELERIEGEVNEAGSSSSGNLKRAGLRRALSCAAAVAFRGHVSVAALTSKRTTGCRIFRTDISMRRSVSARSPILQLIARPVTVNRHLIQRFPAISRHAGASDDLPQHDGFALSESRTPRHVELAARVRKAVVSRQGADADRFGFSTACRCGRRAGARYPADLPGV